MAGPADLARKLSRPSVQIVGTPDSNGDGRVDNKNQFLKAISPAERLAILRRATPQSVTVGAGVWRNMDQLWRRTHSTDARYEMTRLKKDLSYVIGLRQTQLMREIAALQLSAAQETDPARKAVLEKKSLN